MSPRKRVIRLSVSAALLGAVLCINRALAQRGPIMPTDLNQISLRVQALQTIYEFDLSPEQLRDLRAAAGGSASNQQRAKGNAKLSAALKEFYDALAEGSNDERISKARLQLGDALGDENVHLDDDVHPTPAARAKAPKVVGVLKSSQIAAYLASHADEVADPVELMVGTLDELRELRDENAPGAAEEIASTIQANSETAARLVVGADEAKAKALTDQVSAWLKARSESEPAETPAAKKALEDSAKKIIGDVAPMKVLNNWMEQQIAELLSNPQLPAAIETMNAIQRPAP